MTLPWKRSDVDNLFPTFIILDEEGNILHKIDTEEEAIRLTIQYTIREHRPVEVYERTNFSQWKA